MIAKLAERLICFVVRCVVKELRSTSVEAYNCATGESWTVNLS